MTGSEVAQRNPVAEIANTIQKAEFQAQIKAALPANVTLERFTRVTLISIQQNPDILDADRQSLFRSVIRCAQDGLLPDGREAAFVKFNVKGQEVVQYLPMIGGYRKKAAEHGFSIEAHAVYSGDDFDYALGFSPTVTHNPPTLDIERGALIGAYAVATGPDGQKFLEVMSKGEIEDVRKVSRAATSEYGPWVKWPAEMYRKTVARRLFKQLPLGDLDDRTRSMVEASDAEIEIATADVPELAALPTVDVSKASA